MALAKHSMLLSLAIVLFLRGEAAQQACSITDFGAVPGGSEVGAIPLPNDL